VSELLEVDPFGGKTLFAFDGRVLEIFGKVAFISGTDDASRIHVQQLTVKVSGPDKNGLYDVEFVGPTGYPRRYRGLDAPMWGTLRPLVDALRSAGATVEGPAV
jgi:hypothetical protein